MTQAGEAIRFPKLQKPIQNLKKILQHTSFCTFCFDIKSDLVHLDDTLLKGEWEDYTLNHRDILDGIIGNTNALLSDYICESCKSSAVSCYTFIVTSKRTLQMYMEYLTQLDKEIIDLALHADGSKWKNTMIVLSDGESNSNDSGDVKPKISDTSSPLLICDECGNGYHQKKNLVKHLNRHKLGTIYNIATQVSQVQHADVKKKEKISRKDKIYKCSSCDKTLKTKLHLRNHVSKMHEKKPNLCLYCNKQFSSRKGYLEHVQTGEHRKNVPYNILRYHCQQCDYTANTEIMLTAHVNRIHLNIRPFECQYCHKCYFDNAQLRNHMKTHTGDVKVCDICGAHLAGPTALKKHRRLHTGEMPYSCPYCDVKVNCASALKTHIMRKHMEASVPCPLCDQKFHTMNNARGHVRKTHWKSKEKFDFTKLKGLSPNDYDFFRDRRKAVI